MIISRYSGTIQTYLTAFNSEIPEITTCSPPVYCFSSSALTTVLPLHTLLGTSYGLAFSWSYHAIFLADSRLLPV